VATKQSNSASSPKSAKQEAFERDAREKLENADMDVFDNFMKRLVDKPKQPIGTKRINPNRGK
jgi:hypothetical protein